MNESTDIGEYSAADLPHLADEGRDARAFSHYLGLFFNNLGLPGGLPAIF